VDFYKLVITQPILTLIFPTIPQLDTDSNLWL
jgi:hypothetical protein